MKCDNSYKLVSIAGNQHCYQYFMAVVCFLFWFNINILDFSLGFLENPPSVSYYDEEKNETVVESLDYDICDWEKSRYTIVETYKFSWIIDLNIECDQFKVSIIGTLVSVGLLLGASTYSFITKWLGQKRALLIGNFIFMVILAIGIFVNKYWYFCLECVLCPYMCNVISYSIMVLFSEIISHQKKSIFNTCINSGLGIGGLFYVVMYYAFEEWKYVFCVCIGISFVLEILVIFFFFDSFQEYTDKKDIDGMLKALRFIAKMNGKLDHFNKEIETIEYQNILKVLRGGEIPLSISTPRDQRLTPSLEMKVTDGHHKQESEPNNEIIFKEDQENVDKIGIVTTKGDGIPKVENVENQNKKESESKIKSEKHQNKKENEPHKMSQEKKKLTPLALFKYPSVRYTFILFCLLWFFSTALYNGLTIGLKSLPGNIYLNSLLLFLAETPGYFVSGLSMNNKTLGRKYSLIMFTSVFAVTNLLLYLLFDYNTPSIVIYLITRFFVCCAFCIYYTYCLESYPISIAQIAYGINGACNCLGGIVVPFIIEYVEKKTLYLIYCIFAVVCVILMIFLKETNGKPIPEQIKEIEEEELKKLQGGIPVVIV